ncbi:SDR family oxidoreductase [Persicitalea jodogahamensis]|uniref:Short-chain dehydrogenase n=1 Tax=Persicitalea jodogahamensis TaxID=402147 RepID=A0A8J3DA97_9BACT|nr:SDR family oxidoreductase [Persicitalea jodogahamensis]GHB75632.1 short-chain dehydrogenase [Persicitalea jodogahamensis]
MSNVNKKIALITGPTSGIGKITALELAKRGYNLILLARNAQKADALQMEIGDQAETTFVECDLSDLKSVQKAVEKIHANHSRIDLLVNNAGLMMDHEEFSKQDIEMTFAVNHVGHFLLTTGLIDLLKAGKDARIVHVSSGAHQFAKFQIDQLVRPEKFSAWTTYGNSKLANILFSNELAERLQPMGITSNALHPGFVATSFGSGFSSFGSIVMWLARPFAKSPQEGAQTSIYLASSPEVADTTGKYFDDCKPKTPSKDAQSKFLATKLWELSEKLVKDYKPAKA